MTSILLASWFAEGFKTVIGVILSLAGLVVLFAGVVSMVEKQAVTRGIALVAGVILLVAGLWLVGVFSS